MRELVSSSPMSPSTNTALPPSALIRSTVAAPRSPSQSTPTIFAPSRAARIAAAAPMPRAQPVTISVRPARRPGAKYSGLTGGMSFMPTPAVCAAASVADTPCAAPTVATTPAVNAAPFKTSRRSIQWLPAAYRAADIFSELPEFSAALTGAQTMAALLDFLSRVNHSSAQNGYLQPGRVSRSAQNCRSSVRPSSVEKTSFANSHEQTSVISMFRASAITSQRGCAA